MTDYYVRPYKPGDDKEIVQLLNLGFKGWPHFDLSCSSLEHWRWKYRSNELKTNVITVGVSKEKIIGVNHQIPIRIKIGEEEISCHYASDLVVHHDFRRRGISNAMIAMSKTIGKDEGVQLAYYVTADPFLIKSYSRRFLVFPFSISNFVRILDIEEQLNSMQVRKAWLMKFGFKAIKFINDIRNVIEGSWQPDLELQSKEIKSFDKKIDTFWESISNHHDFIIERRCDYLNWRYCDPRAGNFIIKQVEKSNRVLGYIILRINRYLKHYPIGYIVDLLTPPNRPDVAHSLVSDAVRYFENLNINLVSSLIVKNHPNSRILMKHGFLDSRIKLPLFYTLYGKRDMIEKIGSISAKKVHFSYGDLDTLPVTVHTSFL